VFTNTLIRGELPDADQRLSDARKVAGIRIDLNALQDAKQERQSGERQESHVLQPIHVRRSE
jgi:hypothetical protein